MKTASAATEEVLFHQVSFSYETGTQMLLAAVDLHLPRGWTGVVGPNGAGKSTLLRALVEGLTLPEERVTHVPQEITAAQSRQILGQARALPPAERGKLMTVVSCLGSDPGRLLESELPSPGEVRKLLLAFGIARVPHFIVMDEPTNHLDLPSIECLEQALADCPCGLLLVSHDERFLRALTGKRWQVEGRGGDTVLRVVERWEEVAEPEG